MGVGGEKKPMREIDSTKASIRDDAFDAIVERIKMAGNVEKDETVPLYQDIGRDQFEVGTQREIIFSIGEGSQQKDFKLRRKVETSILQGEGHQKHLEETDNPKVTMILQQKEAFSDNWITMDLEDMFG